MRRYLRNSKMIGVRTKIGIGLIFSFFSDVHFSKAIFVRGLSSHSKVASPTSIVTSDTSVNLSWQSTLQRTWENYIHGTGNINVLIFK